MREIGFERLGGAQMFRQRVNVFVGHFGSGKTEVALNVAIQMAAAGKRVALVDLDVVKPYFRSRSARDLLLEAGVELVAPEGDDLLADIPIVAPRVRSLCRDGVTHVVMDAGGDDTGARALGSLSDVLDDETLAVTLVLNFRRPFTPDVAAAVVMAREIEAAARVKVTGVVSNTHLMGQTTASVILEGASLAAKTAAELCVPLLAVAVEDRMFEAVKDAALPGPVLLLHRFVQPPFDQEGYKVPKSGPLFKLL